MKAAAERVAGLHVLADDTPGWKWSPFEQAQAACAGGAAVVQLRAKVLTDAETLEVAQRIRALSREHGVLFVVNDRFDLALAAEADGVHLGQGDLAPGRLPASVRARLLVGRSTHTPEQARAALREPIDYLAFGPVFGTASKRSAWSERGTPALEAVARIAGSQPLVAIGGIDAGNAPAVAAAGASGFAVISAVADAPDPEAAVRSLASAFVTGRDR